VRFVIRNKKAEITTIPKFTVALSFVLFPLGYLLINFEPRYIWYLVPLSMLMASMFILQHLNSNRRIIKVIPYILGATYLLYPAWRMGKMFNEGRAEYDVAKKMKQMNIHGSFAGVPRPGIAAQRMERLAYFSGMSFYTVPYNLKPAEKELEIEMRRYGINYRVVGDFSYYDLGLNHYQFIEGSDTAIIENVNLEFIY
jgi:hypothetical protein